MTKREISNFSEVWDALQTIRHYAWKLTEHETVVLVTELRRIADNISRRSPNDQRAITLENLPDFLTASELAGFLQTTTNSLAQDRYRGYGVPFIRIGRRIRYTRSEVLAYLEQNTYQQSPGGTRVDRSLTKTQ